MLVSNNYGTFTDYLDTCGKPVVIAESGPNCYDCYSLEHYQLAYFESNKALRDERDRVELELKLLRMKYDGLKEINWQNVRKNHYLQRLCNNNEMVHMNEILKKQVGELLDVIKAFNKESIKAQEKV